MENFEGLWIVQFQSNFQTFGTGVAVLIGDRLLGGDTHYYYDGHIAFKGKAAEASIKVVRYNKEGMAIFGNLDSFNLRVSGDLSDSDIALHGNMVEQPSMKITIKGQKTVSL